MKKRLLVLGVIIVMMATSMSCGNQTWFDTTYTFDEAIVYIGGEWKTMKVQSWTDFEDGDQIQFTDENGVTYLVHSSNITLISH